MNTLFFESFGSGKAIVLIHGFCEDRRVWRKIVPQLSKEYKVISFDLSGFGKSTLNTDAVVGLEDMASLLKTELLNNNISECVMIGHSMGGYLTLAFAEKYPQMLKGLGLFHSTATEDTDFKKTNRLKHIDFVERNGVEAFVKTLIPSLFSANNQHNKYVEETQQIAKECSTAGITNSLKAMRSRPERLLVLQKSKVPILFIAGKQDTLVLAKDVALQSSLPSKSQFELFENSGHMGMLEEPEKSVRVIKDFMSLL